MALLPQRTVFESGIPGFLVEASGFVQIFRSIKYDEATPRLVISILCPPAA
jgi:hypothetical protein